jgi:hypothetical protein
MKMEKPIKESIWRNALLSIFIYALPVVLMFVSLYISGQRPWLTHKHHFTQKNASQNNSAND